MLVRERQSAEGDDDSSAEPDPRRRAARRGVIGALAGALIMLVAASALAASGQSVPFLGLSADRGADRTVTGGGLFSAGVDDTPALTSDPGRCLNWERQDGADVREVDCTASHLFEVVGAVTAPQAPGTPFPGDAAWQQVVEKQCAPMARSYLKGRLDPSGRYRAGALKPTPAAWNGGDRTVRCGLQAPGRSGALFTSTGRVADGDQAVVYDPGTCLGSRARRSPTPSTAPAPTRPRSRAPSTSARSSARASRRSTTRTTTCSPPARRSPRTTSAGRRS